MRQTEFTPREIEIVKMIAEGLNSREISVQLVLSEHTIHTHRKNIVRKLGVKNVAHLVHYAWQNGLLNKLNNTAFRWEKQYT